MAIIAYAIHCDIAVIPTVTPATKSLIMNGGRYFGSHLTIGKRLASNFLEQILLADFVRDLPNAGNSSR